MERWLKKVQGIVQVLWKQVGISRREIQYRGAGLGVMGERGRRRMKAGSEGRKIDGR